MITVAIQSHNFNIRLSWMLASLSAQKNLTTPLTVHISCVKNSGVHGIAEHYRSDALIINTKTYKRVKDLEKRGITRTRALQQCSTDWILFADSDHVYHPEYFSRLIRGITPHHYHGIVTAGRISQPDHTAADHLLNTAAPITEVFSLADKLPKVRRSNVGAGYFQLIHTKRCNHGGYYVKTDNCRDWSWTDKYQNARSDIQFRRRIHVKHKLPGWFTHNQIHLNHKRDNQYGKHLTVMR